MSRRRRVFAPSPVEDGRGWGEGAASRSAATLAAALLALVASPALADGPSLPNRVAQLQGLDKVTARVSAFDAPVGKEVRFGTLVITARACLVAPPTEPPESAAFLEIRDVGPGRRRQAGVLGLDVRLEPGPLRARAPGLRRLGGGLRRPAAGAGPGHATAALLGPEHAEVERLRLRREDGVGRQGRREPAAVLGAGDLDRAEAGQVLGDELGIEEAEAARAGAAPPARPGPPSRRRGRARTCSRRRTRPRA